MDSNKIKEIINKFCFGFVEEREERMTEILKSDNRMHGYLAEMKGDEGCGYDGYYADNKNGTITIEHKDEVKVFKPSEILQIISQKTLF